jgi:hypothetical protein
MRVPFQLTGLQPFSFVVDGKLYSYADSQRLAFKPNLVANIEETIIQTPDGRNVWLTVVSADEEADPYGIKRGWYTVQVLDDASANSLVKAFALWAADLR